MKTVAVFDFDGTITRSDSLAGVIRQAVGRWGLVRALLLNLPSIIGWKLGIYTNSESKQRLFSTVFKGMPAEKFYAICNEYFASSWPEILRTGVSVEIDRHIAAGHQVAIVSASSDSWVRPFADALGIDTVIGTGIEVGADNCLTGRFSTANCHGEEKVRRLLDVFGPRESMFLIAYGDSVGDKPLLAIADEAHYKPFR